MDFSNESYVRIYTRDTTTWLRLGWDGQGVLTQILRKLDMSGVLDIADMEPWEAAVVHCRAPEAAARAGMEACLSLGVLEHNGTCLVAPKFREAQEATKSDKLRQRESRERRQLDALKKSQEVTKDNTRVSQEVTEGNAGSRDGTGGNAESPIAVQGSAVQGGAGAGDPLLSFAKAWRRLTGRSEFEDLVEGCGQVGGTEQQWLIDVRKICGGAVSEFEARVSARLASKDRDFLLQQTLNHWRGGPLQARVAAPGGGKSFAQRVAEQEICEH